MEQELIDRLGELEKKIDATYVSAEKTRKYFLYSLLASLFFFLFPIIIAIAAVPFLLGTVGTLSQAYLGL